MRKLIMATVGSWALATLLTACPPDVTGDAAVSDAGEKDVGVTDGGAVDTSTGDSGASPCGDVTSLGACQGATLMYCDTQHNQIASFDCSTVSEGVTCGLTDCDDDPETCWGYDCVTGPGGDCDEDFGADDSVFCDVTQGLGCLDGTCQDSPACAPETFVSSCSDNTLLECWSGRESSYDCGSAQCDADSHGRTYCLGTQSGGCDLSHDPPFECIAGLECSSATAPGRCVEPAPDGGTQDAAVEDAAVPDTSAAEDHVSADH